MCLPRSGGCNEGDGRAQVAPTTAESRATNIPGEAPTLGSHAVINKLAEVVLSGGGARNPTLVSQLEQRLPGVIFRLHGEFGVPADAKEAVAFAVLGYEALHGRTANLPRCTGASRSAILGKITPGDNYVQLMRQVFGDQRPRQEGCNP